MKALPLIACLLLSTSAMAQRTKQFDACMDNIDYGAFKNTQMVACISEEIQRQDAYLQQEFLNIYTYANAQERKEMTEGQKNFLLKREAICRTEEEKNEAPNGKVNYGLCVLERTDKWINVIRSLEPQGPPPKPKAGKRTLAFPIPTLTSQDNRRFI